MEICALTKQVLKILTDANINEKSDAEFLVALSLDVKRSEVYAKTEISEKNAKMVLKNAKKRAKGVPISLIFKNACFYGRDFVVNKNCLCPRPETEQLVEWALEDGLQNKTVLDLCTGSGAIGITLFLEGNPKKVVLSDVSIKALKVARKNAKQLNANVKIIKSDLLKSIKERFDVIISNPPYISNADYQNLEKEVKDFEPKLALCGGQTGLEFYEKIIEQAPTYLNRNGLIFFELGINQAKDVKKLLEKDFCDIIIKKDYAGIDRMICARIKGEG